MFDDYVSWDEGFRFAPPFVTIAEHFDGMHLVAEVMLDAEGTCVVCGHLDNGGEHYRYQTLGPLLKDEDRWGDHVTTTYPL